MGKFIVNMCRIAYGNRDIEVEANSPEEAMEMAYAEAGNYEYREHSADYEAQTAIPVEGS